MSVVVGLVLSTVGVVVSVDVELLVELVVLVSVGAVLVGAAATVL